MDKGGNCQDAYAVTTFHHNNRDWLIGVVCDGCGGADLETEHGIIKGRTEVSASLLSDFVIRRIKDHITSHEAGIAWLSEGMLRDCFYETKQFIINQVMYQLTGCAGTEDDLFILCENKEFAEEFAHLIQKYWLSTILGFVLNDEEFTIFHAGDGVVQIDGELKQIDHNNSPRYLAYNCIPDPLSFGIGTNMLADTFEYYRGSSWNLKRLMIATDGFTHQVPLINSVLGNQWDKKGKTGLKRWLNVKYAEGCFNDDVTLITVEKTNA